VKQSSHPIDRQVGNRVRMRRLMLNMSQTKLAQAVGVTFQQVQKYERGTNRISASRLQQMSCVLQVPIPFFFEDFPSHSTRSKGKPDEPSAFDVLSVFSTADGLNLAKAYMRIKDRKLRLPVLHLIEELAGLAK
jgi:transcriptional regulator with XRE-family HTH domain